MKWCEVLLLCTFSTQILCFQFENVPFDEIVKILLPTLNSKNPTCRNQTLFYLQELKKMKLWATEMFDASAKFPSGLLFGSTYNFGNFDECIEISVPLENEKIQGRYCLVEFHIDPPNFEQNAPQIFRFYNNNQFGNTSTWEKILAFSNDRSRSTRNDFYFSYCIPSSCHYDDLESSLQEFTSNFNTFSDFQITATVNSRHCQLKRELSFTIGDISFISVVAIFFLLALVATLYEWLMKLDDLQQFKLQGKKHEILMSFSVWTNLKKLCEEKENDEGLQCIHGLKVLSMFLIIMGHRIMFIVGSPLLNPNFVESFYGKIEATVLLNGPIIVDTFFNISGFLVCYLLLTQFEKLKSKVSVIFLYFHRFVRLTPAYAIVLAFYCTLFIKTGSGPLWLERVELEQERCIASWWANIFYLNNYINKDQICMFQSWYMTCDMHFFIVAPIIVWLLRKKPSLGLAVLFIVTVLSVSVVFTTVYLNEEDAILLLYMRFLKDPVTNNTFKNVYIPTHMRASPYFIGMVTGYLKYIMRSKQYKMPKYMVYMGWIMSIFIIEVTVYSAFIFYIPGKAYDPLMSAIYASMHHVTWSICISWMIIAISEGNGAWVELILGWKPLVLLSRITYSAFLCHGAIQIYTAAVQRQSNYASIFHLVYNTAGDITLAYVCGIVLSMLFEAPILSLEKILLRKNSHNDEKKNSKISEVDGITPKIKVIHRF